MSRATNDDLHLASIYRAWRRMGASEREARNAARGRDVTDAALSEALRRADDEVATIPAVQAQERLDVALGMDEAQAREQALDLGWELIQEARHEARPSSGTKRVVEDDHARQQRLKAGTREFLREVEKVRPGFFAEAGAAPSPRGSFGADGRDHRPVSHSRSVRWPRDSDGAGDGFEQPG